MSYSVESKAEHRWIDPSTLHFNTRAKTVIKTAEMPIDMIEKVVELCDEGMNESLTLEEIAEKINSTFDRLYPHGFWQCIVGQKYSCLVTHESGSFLQFFVGKLAVNSFKCKF